MTNDLQLDIFGNEIPVERIAEKKPQETIKNRWRRMYGYDEAHRCGDCKYLCKYATNDSHYYKCNLMGISASEATDIRLKDVACKRWEESS
jgi:hypothetical protein